MKINKLLIAIFLLALGLRMYYVFNQNLLFIFDMGRDLYHVSEIAGGDIKILGPSTGVGGFFHGVLYYYTLLPAFIIGGGSPVFITGFVALVHSLFVFVIYKIAKDFFDEKTAIVSSLIYAVSLETVQYGTWLSNPTFGLLTIPLIYYFLYKKNLPMSALFLGLSIQFNFSYAFHFVGIIGYLIYTKYKFNLLQLIKSAAMFALATSTMILAEFKFGFKSLQGLKQITLGGGAYGADMKFGDYLIVYINKMGIVFANNIFPMISSLGILLAIGLLIHFTKKVNNKKQKDLLTLFMLWIFGYIIAGSIGGTNVPHVTAGIGVGLIIAVSYAISNIFKNNKLFGVILIALILFANLYKVYSTNNAAQYLFAAHPNMILKRELELIDYTYQQAEGEPFSIDTLTAPLFINTTWSYLYNWYGMKNYGYLPAWRGRDQIGSLGNNLENATDEKIHFLIFEDQSGIPEQYIDYAIGDSNVYSKVIEDTVFGGLRIQKREVVLENEQL